MSDLVETLRAYVALPLDLVSARRAVDVVRALRPALTAAGWSVAWQSPAALHVTVRNLGALDPGLAGALGDAVKSVAARHAPFRIRLAGAELRGEPAELCLPVTDGHEAIVRVANDLDDALEALGFARPARPLRARVGLGRVRAAGPSLPPLTALDGGATFVGELRLHRLDGARPDAEPPVLTAAMFSAAPRPPDGQGMSAGRR